MDGTQKTHNINWKRKDGSDSFDMIEYVSFLFEQYDINYNILTVVTPPVAQNIREIYDFYHQKGWKYQQYIPCLEPLEEGHGYWTYSLGEEQYGDFLITLFELWKSDLQKGRQPYIRQFEQWVKMAVGFFHQLVIKKGIAVYNM